jgi:hypothetical protein
MGSENFPWVSWVHSYMDVLADTSLGPHVTMGMGGSLVSLWALFLYKMEVARINEALAPQF